MARRTSWMKRASKSLLLWLWIWHQSRSLSQAEVFKITSTRSSCAAKSCPPGSNRDGAKPPLNVTFYNLYFEDTFASIWETNRGDRRVHKVEPERIEKGFNVRRAFSLFNLNGISFVRENDQLPVKNHFACIDSCVVFRALASCLCATLPADSRAPGESSLYLIILIFNLRIVGINLNAICLKETRTCVDSFFNSYYLVVWGYISAECRKFRPEI